MYGLVARAIRNAIWSESSGSRESLDSRESCESIRTNHATKIYEVSAEVGLSRSTIEKGRQSNESYERGNP